MNRHLDSRIIMLTFENPMNFSTSIESLLEVFVYDETKSVKYSISDNKFTWKIETGF